MPFTPEEKRKSVEREIAYRRYVYSRRVEAGKMRRETADREIAIFEEIAEDYRRQEQQERLI